MAMPAKKQDIPGIDMPTWILKFDKTGICTSPETRAALLAELNSSKGYHQIIFMSHGWNTDFADALGQYGRFLTHFETIAKPRANDSYQPIFVGVAWPSVWFPIDKGPAIASAGDPDNAIAKVAEAVTAGPETGRMVELLSRPSLTREETEEAVRLAFSALSARSEDELPGASGLKAEEVVRAVAQMQAATEPPEIESGPRRIGSGGVTTIAEAQVAGVLGRLNPLHLLRLFSLYAMKDRAGRVGSQGVASLLRDLAATGLPVHLVGHSFGAKVMLSALVSGAPPSKPVSSALLLQPAISHLSFATEVKGRKGPGGYIAALAPERVRGAVLTTYSRGDFPLHDVFHRALRRPEDLGDIKIATEAGEPPSVYAALGGYGPRTSMEELVDPIRKPGDPYDLTGKRLVGLDGSQTVDFPAASSQRRIPGHGEVANPYTAWALFQQLGV